MDYSKSVYNKNGFRRNDIERLSNSSNKKTSFYRVGGKEMKVSDRTNMDNNLKKLAYENAVVFFLGGIVTGAVGGAASCAAIGSLGGPLAGGLLAIFGGVVGFVVSGSITAKRNKTLYSISGHNPFDNKMEEDEDRIKKLMDEFDKDKNSF